MVVYERVVVGGGGGQHCRIEGQKTQLLPTAIVAVISIGVAMVAGSRSSTGLKSELCSAMCSAFEQYVCSASFKN